MCVYISSIFCRRSIRIMDALICYKNIINMLVNYIQLSLYLQSPLRWGMGREVNSISRWKYVTKQDPAIP